MDSLKELSLFSGSGGFSLGLRLAGLNIKTLGYVEIDRSCQQIIQARIRDGFLDDAPIWSDISAFDGGQCRGMVDIVTAGFPCQPHSVAGQRRGEADERNLWPDTLRVIREVGPRYVLLENVPGILVDPGYAGTVVGELAGIGYDCIWDCIPAAAVGAPHLRWRWWCLAYADQGRRKPDGCQYQEVGRAEYPGGNGQDGDVANAAEPRRRRGEFGESGEVRDGTWGSEPQRRSADVADAEEAQWWRPDTTQHAGRRHPEAGGCSQQVGRAEYWAVEPPLC